MTRRLSDGGRARVIDTARAFFAQKGFHQTAMAELSERAEVSVGQIYRLFANKGDMISAIIHEDIAARIARLAHIRDETGAGRLSAHEALRQVVLDALNGGQEALTMEIVAEGSRNPAIGTVIGDLCEQYRAMLRDIALKACPGLSGARLEAVEEMLVAILFGLGNRSLSRPTLTIEETASLAADMLLTMLAC